MPKFQFSGVGGGWGVFSTGQNWKVIKCQEMPEFQLGGYSPLVKIEKSSNAKKCLNFNFRVGGGRGYSPLDKIEKSSNAMKCLNFNFRGGGGGGGILHWSKLKSHQMPRNAKIPIFFLGGGILGTKSQNRVNWDFWTKFSTTPASLCITDSPYVETNNLS